MYILYSVCLHKYTALQTRQKSKYIRLHSRFTEWKVPVLQELLNTSMNNLYVEGFDDYVITEMINMFCNE